MKNSFVFIACLLLTMAVNAQPVSNITDRDHKESADLVLYPNPASDVIYIEHARPVTEIRILDILGQVVGEFTTTRNRNYVLDISELQKGIYFVRVTDEENNTYSQKVLKQ